MTRPRPTVLTSILRLAALALVAAYILLPMVQTVVLSFTATIAREGLPEGSSTLSNYSAIFTTPALRDSLLNSVVYVSLNVALCLAVGLPAAYALSRYRFTGDRHLLMMLLAFRMTPPVVLSLPIFTLFAQFGLINSPVGIGIVHCLFNLPVAIWILESFMSAVPRELDETARIDGHSLPDFFLRFLIPAIAPGIGVTAFFCFIFSWVEVVFARILTGTGGKPVTMAIDALFTFQTDIGLVMAMTVFSLIPGIAVIWLVRNHIARGFVVRV